MGLLEAISTAAQGAFADQWKEIVVPTAFDEHSAVVPGVIRHLRDGRGENINGTTSVLSNGSKIYVPENTAAFIFNQSGIIEVVTTPGGYKFTGGQRSVFNGNIGAITGQIVRRFGFGGVTADEMFVSYVNLREIRGLKFGTKSPQIYHDNFYDMDLAVTSYGTFSVAISNPETFVRMFLPPMETAYSFDDQRARQQLMSEFLQSFGVALNSLSNTYRISQLPSQANAIQDAIVGDTRNAGSWPKRFGITLRGVGIEGIRLTESSRNLVNAYNVKKAEVKPFDSLTQKGSDIAAQQKIAEGIRESGFGDAGGMAFALNLVNGMTTKGKDTGTQSMTVDEQVATLKKFKELFDQGILTEEELNAKKREILGM